MSEMYAEEEYGDSDAREEDGEVLQGGDSTGRWYQNDLFLAAELGKTLLERNRDLENQLRTSQQTLWDRQNEVDLLTRQLDVLRDVGDSRGRLYEEVDKHLQDAEKNNEALKQQAKLSKSRIERLTDTVETLESRCDDLTSQVTELKSQERKQRVHDKRTWSEPSLVDLPDNHPTSYHDAYDFLGFPNTFRSKPPSKEVQDLKETLRNLRREVNMLKRKQDDTDEELNQQREENQTLEAKINELQDEQRTREEFEEHRRTSMMCRECGGRLNSVDGFGEQNLIEHDLSEIPHGEVHRLKNGGSAYGSRESLNMIGLQTEGNTPTVEIVRDILAADFEDAGTEEKKASGEDSPTGGAGRSILGELEEQYRRLVTRYETLIEIKNTKRAEDEKKLSKDTAVQADDMQPRPVETVRPTQLSIPSSATAEQVLDFRSPLDPIEGRFENGPPEYKRLFKEIFETLRRSVVYDDDFDVLAASQE
ncbi:hypothetical protein CAPTEDRAFT_192483 [Capitella teleta]|uniref:Cerebellar degeneration-related protein 2-like n=1 Tax=Capitella teleta TaxID=283909 RepID=R7U331_CAPTE|nr:hypothetical protein CAPTEDRAFT_192483 [Capitella teleta]|eukprot:ELU00389.1 hypothetical protein CAPTEDRAFT_192483 [Capitella teleta]